MRGINADQRDEFDDYYAENTHVHSTLDTELRYPNGERIGSETLTLEEYKAKC